MTASAEPSGSRACSCSRVRWAEFERGDRMRRRIDSYVRLSISGAFCAAIFCVPLAAPSAQTTGGVLHGPAAFGDWRADRPGVQRLITPHDLPPPEPAQSVANMVRVVHRTNEKPLVPSGFAVDLFASGLAGPRLIRAAANGDV